MKNILSKFLIKKAAQAVMNKTERDRNQFLENLQIILMKNEVEIIKANKIDIVEARKNNLQDSFIQRLHLDERGIEEIILKLKALKSLKSGIGEIIERKK